MNWSFFYFDRFTLTKSKQALMISKKSSTVKNVCMATSY